MPARAVCRHWRSYCDRQKARTRRSGVDDRLRRQHGGRRDDQEEDERVVRHAKATSPIMKDPRAERWTGSSHEREPRAASAESRPSGGKVLSGLTRLRLEVQNGRSARLPHSSFVLPHGVLSRTTYCWAVTCGSDVERRRGDPGWQHLRQAGDESLGCQMESVGKTGKPKSGGKREACGRAHPPHPPARGRRQGRIRDQSPHPQFEQGRNMKRAEGW